MADSPLRFMAVVFGILCLYSATACQEPFMLYSPNRNLYITLTPDDRNIQLLFSYNKEVFLEMNNPGFMPAESSGNTPEIIGTEWTSHDDTWHPVWGSRSEIHNRYQGLSVTVRKGALKYVIECRAFDDGLAFRYVLEEPGVVVREQTVFRLKEDYHAWSFTQNWGIDVQEKMSAGRLDRVNTPLTFDAGWFYFSITEAALKDYAPMFLHRTGGLDLQAEPGGERKGDSCCVTIAGPVTTPWRVVIAGDGPGDLVLSSIIQNLNEPCAIEDPSWIKPGSSLWDWRVHGAVYDGFTYGMNTESWRRFIDFASEQGISYVLFDAGWYGPEWDAASDPLTSVPGCDAAGSCRYARSKNVSVWLYINDLALRHYNLDTILSTYRNWGVAGIKHGFLSSPTRDGVNFSLKVLECCAKYRLMYDCHEAVKPSGWNRTWPNYMAVEYLHSLADGPGNPATTPTEVCVIPFLQNLAGPLDRNPGMFELNSSRGRDKVRIDIPSTVCNQLAQCLVIFSGLLCLPDAPEAYERKEDLFEFLRKLPMSWDETLVFNAEIGKSLTIARRSGREWFVASLTDEQGGLMDIPLHFLDEGTAYELTAYEDAPESHYLDNKEAYRIQRVTVVRNGLIRAKLAPGGGHCMWIRPETN